MKRSLLGLLLLALAVPACRTAAPRPAPGTVVGNPLSTYVGERRLLRIRNDKPRIRVDAREPLTGSCVIAVSVGAAAFDKGTAQLSLTTLGVPRVKGRPAECRRVPAELQLAIFGFSAAPAAAELVARVDAVLQRPEAYLAALGIRFDLPAGEAPGEVASRETFATNAEQSLARHVTAWPTPLLSVDPWYRDPARRLRQESEVELDVIVGGDGRLHRPRVRTALGDPHQNAVLAALSLWRFEPARRGEAPYAVRIAVRPALRIY